MTSNINNWNNSTLVLELYRYSGTTNASGTVEYKIQTQRINVSEPSERFSLLMDEYNDMEYCSVSATSIKYDMGMYVPDHFIVTLSITSKANIPMLQVSKFLMGLKAKVIHISSEGTESDLAKT